MIHLQTGLNDFTKMKLEMVWMICLLNKMINFSQIGLNDLLIKIIEQIWMIHSLNTQVDSFTFTFTFSHLADAFIQSDLQLGST